MDRGVPSMRHRRRDRRPARLPSKDEPEPLARRARLGLSDVLFVDDRGRDHSIKRATDAAAHAKRGIWAKFSSKLAFDPNLRFEKAATGSDAGPVLFPKLFRRLATEYVADGNVDDFKGYLERQEKPDVAFLTDEFLTDGITAAVQHRLSEFVDGKTFTKRPEELVFQEAASTLLDKNNHRITKW
jgi:hypothetical protein